MKKSGDAGGGGQCRQRECHFPFTGKTDLKGTGDLFCAPAYQWFAEGKALNDAVHRAGLRVLEVMRYTQQHEGDELILPPLAKHKNGADGRHFHCDKITS